MLQIARTVSTRYSARFEVERPTGGAGMRARAGRRMKRSKYSIIAAKVAQLTVFDSFVVWEYAGLVR